MYMYHRQILPPVQYIAQQKLQQNHDFEDLMRSAHLEVCTPHSHFSAKDVEQFSMHRGYAGTTCATPHARFFLFVALSFCLAVV